MLTGSNYLNARLWLNFMAQRCRGWHCHLTAKGCWIWICWPTRAFSVWSLFSPSLHENQGVLLLDCRYSMDVSRNGFLSATCPGCTLPLCPLTADMDKWMNETTKGVFWWDHIWYWKAVSPFFSSGHSYPVGISSLWDVCVRTLSLLNFTEVNCSFPHSHLFTFVYVRSLWGVAGLLCFEVIYL